MTIRIVSHLEVWSEKDLHSGANVPASVPALRALQRRGIPYVTVASMLSAADYHETWRESLLAVWKLIERSRQAERQDQPNLVLIHGYSLYVLLCQIRLMAIALDRIADRLRCQSLLAEDPAAQADDAILCYSGLNSPYYHEVALAWAQSRGLTTGTTPAPRGLDEPRATRARPGFGFLELRRAVRRGPRKRAYRLYNEWRTARFFRRPGDQHGMGRTLFYMSSEACGLGIGAPSNAVDVRPQVNRLLKAAESDATPLDAPPITSALTDRWGPFADLIETRWRRHIASTSGPGMAVYRGFSRILATLDARGGRCALVMPSPFNDAHFNGYIAEAFRHTGGRVAGIQHGGNMRLVRRASDALALTDLMGGQFFQWGAGSTDEFATYGLSLPFTAIATGSIRTADVIRKRKRPVRRARKRLLYVPTLLNVLTATGANIPWEAYCGLIPEVCSVLDRSGWECWVKILDWPEYASLGLEKLPNLRVIRRGSAFEYMSDVDAIVIDALIGSPFYEALATDKPIVLYEGAESHEWDPSFVEGVRRRALCFWDPASYLDGLRTFLENPEDALRRAGVRLDDELMRTYCPPTTPSHLWACLERGLFEPAVG